jgi:phage baseplate assembly protein W
MPKELLGKDLKLVEEDLGSELGISLSGDLETVSGELNLGQAIAHRLRVRQGELSDLGHPHYGSRLFELVGEPNNERTRELARVYTRECVLQDPRVNEVVDIRVTVPKNQSDRIDINISVLHIGSMTAMNIVFPFYLEVA